MAVASPRHSKLTRWRGGVQVDRAAERDDLAWSLLNLEEEMAGFAFESLEAPPEEDDGFDHRDPADDFCLNFAGPSIAERDPNAAIHDQYTGTVYD